MCTTTGKPELYVQSARWPLPYKDSENHWYVELFINYDAHIFILSL